MQFELLIHENCSERLQLTSIPYDPALLAKPEQITVSEHSPPIDETTSENDEFTIDELAARTRVSSRTIRFYQSKGALTKPTIKGRVAYYNEQHVERLGLIAKLQDQGLRIKAIRDLLARADKGELVINEWLGLKEELQSPWAQDKPQLLSKEELYDFIGDSRTGLIGELLRLDIIRENRGAYSVRSPALLKVVMTLESAGVDVETSREAAQILRKHLAKASGELGRHFLTHFMDQTNDADVVDAFRTLRPTGLEAVQLIFGQEMERVLRELVESGKTASVKRRKKS
jgi:DNA-binding transcriptional MerR regulator